MTAPIREGFENSGCENAIIVFARRGKPRLDYGVVTRALVAAHRDGGTVAEVAARLRVSKSTLSLHARRLGLVFGPRAQRRHCPTCSLVRAQCPGHKPLPRYTIQRRQD